MIDYELMRSELEERQSRARRAAEVRRMLAGGAVGQSWRNVVGLGMARLGLRLAGPGAAAALRMGPAR
jgi:hypothetical protein